MDIKSSNSRAMVCLRELDGGELFRLPCVDPGGDCKIYMRCYRKQGSGVTVQEGTIPVANTTNGDVFVMLDDQLVIKMELVERAFARDVMNK